MLMRTPLVVRLLLGLLFVGFAVLLVAQEAPPAVQEDPAVAAVRASDEQFVKSFDGAKASELAALFAPSGELIDEEGTLTQGTKELTELFTAFFEKFPSAKLKVDVESVRMISRNLAMEEANRLISVATAKDEEDQAQFRYSAVRIKSEDGRWLIASVREFADDPPPTGHDELQPLAWLVGDWVNEGADAAVKISFRWSEDENFLLGDYQVTVEGQPALKSTHRIGWDAAAGRVRSWLFDGDGGFSEGRWTEVEDGWVVRSSAVNPDGTTGTATITIAQTDDDHYVMKGTDRIVGGQREPDLQLLVVRKPPAGRS